MYPFKSTFKPLDGSPNVSSLNNTISDEVQWPSQVAYQHIDLDKVDWAALAQQWIHMKETCPKDEIMPEPPPPPSMSMQDSRPSRLSLDEPPPPPMISCPPPPLPYIEMEEKGEAPMEVEHEDEVPAPPSFPTSSGYPATRTWNQSSMQDNHQNSKSKRTQAHHSSSHSNDQNNQRQWHKSKANQAVKLLPVYIQ